MQRTSDPAVAHHRASRWTWRVDSDQLSEAVHSVEKVLTGEPLVLIAISNGVAVAAELALLHEPLAMWFASGVPAEVPALDYAIDMLSCRAMRVLYTRRSDESGRKRSPSFAVCSSS